MAYSEKIAFVLVNYQSASDIHHFLGKMSACEAIQAIVIDNSGEYEAFGTELIARPGRNLGFGGAINFATRQRFQLPEYMALVNPDIDFEENQLSTFIEKLLSASPFTLALNEPDAGRRCLALNKPRHEFSWHVPDDDLYPRARASLLPFTGFHFVILNTQDFIEAGGFDEKFFMYAEDYDLTARLMTKFDAIRFKYCRFPVNHRSGGSYKGILGKIRRLIHSYRSNYRFIKKHSNLFSKNFSDSRALLALKLAAPKYFK